MTADDNGAQQSPVVPIVVLSLMVVACLLSGVMLTGLSSSRRLPPIFKVSARFNRLRSPPDSTPASFCWSGPLKPKEAT